jgi:cholest-4-en-3-one 26-monooxygenase
MSARPGEVDLADPDLFRDGIPHELFATMRRNSPIAWRDDGDGRGGFWSVVCHADVVAATRDPALSSERGIMIFDQPELAAPNAPRMMIEMDAPRHTRYRLLVNKGFTPRMVARLEDHVRDITRAIIDRVAPAGACDFVVDVASELPLEVIAELLGVPAEDRHQVYEWSNAIIGFDDDGGTATGPAVTPMAAMYEYANRLAAAKRAEPSDDVVTALLDAEVDGERLSEAEFDLFFMLLAVAGNETTRTAISHGMLAFCERPDQWARLRSDRALLPSAVEEILRWSTPILSFRRTALADTAIGDAIIEAGQKVVLWYASANFDEAVFGEPLRFDIARSPNEHVTFGGGGPHFCLGANLARLEIRVMVEELLDRLPDIELAGPVQRLRSNFTHGLKSMPVRFGSTA